MRKKKEAYILENVILESISSDGKAIVRVENKVIFVEGGIPGDRVNIKVFQSKKNFSLAKIENLLEPSPYRIEPLCPHFSVCGGCKWQHLTYDKQLEYKQQQVIDAFKHLGHFEFPEPLNIIGSKHQYEYRNKLDFSVSDARWFLPDEKELDLKNDPGAIGFHVSARYDKVLDINQCLLMPDMQNQIRNDIRKFCKANEITFYNLREHEGMLRSLIFRKTLNEQWMLIIQFAYINEEKMHLLLNHIKTTYNNIHSLLYCINTKKNDVIYDQEIKLYDGEAFITENIKDLNFKIQAKSFFQTNSHQTEVLYQRILELADFNGSECVYDLYTGVGTIACYVAKYVKKVIGIEYVEDAIRDAKINALNNRMEHLHFYSGDMKDVLNDLFIKENGSPDVIITDPPRAGMHPDVVKKLLDISCPKIIYVSCNPATQARDLESLTTKYTIEQIQPVDMFPHTTHVENIAVLKLK